MKLANVVKLLVIISTTSFLSACFQEDCEDFVEPTIAEFADGEKSISCLEGNEYSFSVDNAQEKTTYTWILPNGEEVNGTNLKISNFSVSDTGLYVLQKSKGKCELSKNFRLKLEFVSPDCTEERNVLYMVDENGNTSTLKIISVATNNTENDFRTNLYFDNGTYSTIDFNKAPTEGEYVFSGGLFANEFEKSVGIYFEFGHVEDYTVPLQEYGVNFFVKNEGDKMVGTYCNIKSYNRFSDNFLRMSAEFEFDL